MTPHGGMEREQLKAAVKATDACLTVDELSRLPNVSNVRAGGGGNYSLSVTEPHVALPAVMNWLRERNSTLLGLSTRHTTLEDVFVTLTGRHLRDGD